MIGILIVYILALIGIICGVASLFDNDQNRGESDMWKAIIDILRKKACFHDWKLVKEVEIACIHYQFIYICQKCGEIKQIDVKQL